MGTKSSFGKSLIYPRLGRANLRKAAQRDAEWLLRELVEARLIDADLHAPGDGNQFPFEAGRPLVRDHQAERKGGGAVARLGYEAHGARHAAGAIAGAVGSPLETDQKLARVPVVVRGPAHMPRNEVTDHDGLLIDVDLDHPATSGTTSKSKVTGTSTPSVVTVTVSRHVTLLLGTASDCGYSS